MHPGLVATALHDGSDPSALLERGSGGKALAVLAEGHEKARRKVGPGAREVIKKLVVGLPRREGGYLRFEARDAGGQYPQLRQQGLN